MAMHFNTSAGFRCRPVARVRAPVTVHANPFSFSFGSAKKGVDTSGKAAELVSDIVKLTVATGAGTSASAGIRTEVARLVGELQPYSVKNACKSDLLFGEYEVVYVSDPKAAGTPFEGPSGIIPFTGKLPRQIISTSGEVTNDLVFKQFGVMEGFSRQLGQINAVSATQYEVNLSQAEFKSGLGPAQKLGLESTLNVDVLYLGDKLRVVKNSVEGEDDSEVIIIYKRVGADDDDDGDDEEEEEEQEESTPFGNMLFGPKKAGFATISERTAMKQMQAEEAAKKSAAAATRKQGSLFFKAMSGPLTLKATPADPKKPLAGKGTQAVKAATIDPKKAAAATQAQRAKEAAEKQKEALRVKAEREKEALQIKAEREKEAAQKVADVQAAKARAEAEKKAAAERQAEIKDLLATLSDQLREAQDNAKEAVISLKNVERDSSSVLKDIAAENEKIFAAEKDTAEILEKLENAADVRKDADGAFKQAKAVLSNAQAALKQAVSAQIVSK